MKKALLFLFVLAGTVAYAQITVGNETFPQAGDTLRAMTDLTTADIEITAPGENLEWDYTNLSSGFINTNPVGAASDGQFFDNFPNADLFISLGLNAENYLEANETILGDWGFNSQDEQNQIFNVIARYSTPYILQRAPLNYLDENEFSTTLLFPVAKEDLPDTLVDQIPNGDLIDSIRIRVEIDQSSTVDAYGNIAIPGAEYEVLRDRRYEVRETFVDLKSTVFPIWVDISGSIEDLLPGIVGKDTVNYDYFLSGTEKEPILVLNHDVNGDVTQAVFKYEGILTGISSLSRTEPDFNAFPNPAIDKIKIQSTNIPDGVYSIRIFNLLGKNLYLSNHIIKESGSEIVIDVSHLSKGTYFFSILDELGKPIRTKRLMVIRP